jgi:Tol biopolymer transport system component
MGRFIASIVSSIVLAACTATVGTDSSGQVSSRPPPNPDGRILFASSQNVEDSDNDPQSFFSADPDGSHRKEILPAELACCSHWSPDGSQISISALSEDGRITAAIVRADGNERRVLPIQEPNLNLGPGPWSPTGDRIAFEGWIDDDPSRIGIYTAATDGSHLQQLTTNGTGATDEGDHGHDLPQSFSPGGDQLLFVRDDFTRDPQRSAALFIVNIDGTDVRRLTPWLPRDSGEADWSPDGAHIVYTVQDYVNRRSALFGIDTDGTERHEIKIDTGGQCQFVECYFVGSPSWSPDGTRILVWLLPEWGTNEQDLYTVAPDGSDLRQVTHTPEREGWTDWVRPA